jgi:hypothetical protein
VISISVVSGSQSSKFNSKETVMVSSNTKLTDDSIMMGNTKMLVITTVGDEISNHFGSDDFYQYTD